MLALADVIAILVSLCCRHSTFIHGSQFRHHFEGGAYDCIYCTHRFHYSHSLRGDLRMVKSVIGVNHQGLRDWLFQRVSAVVMAVYSFAMVLYFLFMPHFAFDDWHDLIGQTWMKVATIVFIVSLLYHAWIGMWTVVTDYIKPTALALLAHVFIFFVLFSCFFWALMILWGI